MSDLGERCDGLPASQVTSPDGAWTATVWERTCFETTLDSTVSLHRPAADFRAAESVVCRIPGDHRLTVTWTQPGRLSILCPGCDPTVVIERRELVQGIKTTFDFSARPAK